MKILKYDETESGPRMRRSLEKHGIKPILVESDVGGVCTKDFTDPTINLYKYRRPSNKKTVWLIEAQIYFPPDVILYRSWVLEERPSQAEIRDIVSRNLQ